MNPKPTILIVDDELDIAEVLGDLLGDAGYAVITASNGREGLEKLEREQPALMLLDVMMPIMSGDEVLETLERRGTLHRVPIVVMSAADGRPLAEAYGCAYIKKPTTMRTVLQTIERVLGQPGVAGSKVPPRGASPG